MKDIRIQKLLKTRSKNTNNLIDITKFLDSDIELSNTLTTELSDIKFDFIIREKDINLDIEVARTNGDAFIVDNMRLPSFVEESDLITVEIFDTKNTDEHSFGYFIVSLIQTEEINIDNQLIESNYKGRLAAISLEKYLQGFAMPNKTFTNPSFIDGYTGNVKLDYNLELIYNQTMEIANDNSATKDLFFGSLPIISITPIESSIGKSFSDIVPDRNYSWEGLNLWEILIDLFRDLQVIPGLRYVISGTDLVLELYDKQERFKDVTTPFIDLDNEPSQVGYEETIDAESFNSNIILQFGDSPIGTDIAFVNGNTPDTHRDYYEFPARGGLQGLTSFERKTFYTKEDRKSAIFKLPYPINGINQAQYIDSPEPEDTGTKSKIIDDFNNHFIKGIDIVDANDTDNKFVYNIGEDFIGGFFEASTIGTTGDPRTIMENKFGWGGFAEGEGSVDYMKMKLDYVPILNNFRINHFRNNSQGISIPSANSISKTRSSYTRFDAITSIKDKLLGQSFNSFTQILRYSEDTIPNLINRLFKLGDRTVDNRVVTSLTFRLSRGDVLTSGEIINKVDLVKNFVQANLDSEAISSFDPLGGSIGGVIRNDIIENFMIVSPTSKEPTMTGRHSDLFINNTMSDGVFTSSKMYDFTKHLFGLFEGIETGQGTRVETPMLTAGAIKVDSDKPYHLAGKAFTGTNATGVIFTTQDEVNIAPPIMNARTGQVSSENIISMIQAKYGNDLQKGTQVTFLGRRKIVTPIGNQVSIDNIPSIVSDRTGYFSYFPRFENFTPSDYAVLSTGWAGNSKTHNTTIASREPEQETILEHTYDFHKDTKERVDFTFQISAISHPEILYGPGLLSGNVYFSSIRATGKTSGYTIMYSEEEFPNEIMNIRELFEQFKYNTPFNLSVDSSGVKDVYKPLGTIAAVVESPGSRYSDITIATVSIGSILTTKKVEDTLSNEGIGLRGNKHNLTITLTDNLKYYMVFNGDGMLVYRNLKPKNDGQDFDELSVIFDIRNPFLATL